MQTLKKQHDDLTKSVVENLCLIRDTSRILPHTVFIEEEYEGEPEYVKYQLLSIHEDGGCSILDCNGIRIDDQYTLYQINIDWLLTIWERHNELLVVNGLATVDDEDPMRCEHCGSTNVQRKAWVRPNSGNEYVDDVDPDDDHASECWCGECEDHHSIMFESNLIADVIDPWWDYLDHSEREIITGIEQGDMSDNEYEKTSCRAWEQKTNLQKIASWNQYENERS